ACAWGIAASSTMATKSGEASLLTGEPPSSSGLDLGPKRAAPLEHCRHSRLERRSSARAIARGLRLDLPLPRRPRALHGRDEARGIRHRRIAQRLLRPP